MTLWSVRIAFLFYVLALTAWLTRRPTPAKYVWTAGFLFYVFHVLAAFSAFHHWSHDAAYRETARQTADLFGIRWGGGLYFNYVFTAVWAADVVWVWLNRSRARWITATVHGFMGFMFFNGVVVFASGWTRWSGVIATVFLVWLAFSTRGYTI